MTTAQTPQPTSKPSEQSNALPRTWKPTIAGILIIIAGITAIVAEIIHLSSGGLGIFAGVPFVEFSGSLGGGLFATGVIAIVGGALTLLRKVFWLAVVGVFALCFSQYGQFLSWNNIYHSHRNIKARIKRTKIG